MIYTFRWDLFLMTLVVANHFEFCTFKKSATKVIQKRYVIIRPQQNFYLFEFCKICQFTASYSVSHMKNKTNERSTTRYISNLW